MNTTTYADTMAQLEKATGWLRWARSRPGHFKDPVYAARVLERYIWLLSAKARRQWREGQR